MNWKSRDFNAERPIKETFRSENRLRDVECSYRGSVHDSSDCIMVSHYKRKYETNESSYFNDFMHLLAYHKW